MAINGVSGGVAYDWEMINGRNNPTLPAAANLVSHGPHFSLTPRTVIVMTESFWINRCYSSLSDLRSFSWCPSGAHQVADANRPVIPFWIFGLDGRMSFFDCDDLLVAEEFLFGRDKLHARSEAIFPTDVDLGAPSGRYSTTLPRTGASSTY